MKLSDILTPVEKLFVKLAVPLLINHVGALDKVKPQLAAQIKKVDSNLDDTQVNALVDALVVVVENVVVDELKKL